MTAAVCVVLFFVYWKLGKKDPVSKHFKGGGGSGGGMKDKAVRAFHAFRVLILFSAVCTLLSVSIFGYSLRPLVAAGGTTVLGWIGAVFGVSGGIVATVLLIIALITFFADVLHDMKVDKPATSALVMIPFLAIMATGTIAATAETVTSSMTNPQAVVSLFH